VYVGQAVSRQPKAASTSSSFLGKCCIQTSCRLQATVGSCRTQVSVVAPGRDFDGKPEEESLHFTCSCCCRRPPRQAASRLCECPALLSVQHSVRMDSCSQVPASVSERGAISTPTVLFSAFPPTGAVTVALQPRLFPVTTDSRCLKAASRVSSQPSQTCQRPPSLGT
jgi:hypothetical protein